ncbi:hypothetical protein Tco_0920827 [Tanacetum coccineum]
MRAEIKVLQGQVDGLHIEYSRLILEEKNGLIINRLCLLFGLKSKEIDSLKQDRAAVVSKVIPDAAMKLVRSDDLGYRPSSKEEYDQAGDALANASYPFLAKYIVNPYASLEQLLSKEPPSLRPILSGPRSEPLSSKVFSSPLFVLFGIKVLNSLCFHTYFYGDDGFRAIDKAKGSFSIAGLRRCSVCP